MSNAYDSDMKHKAARVGILSKVAGVRQEYPALRELGRHLKPFEYVVKDSGQRAEFDSGMVRDVTTGKSRPDLVRDGSMFQRWVTLMTNGAKKYAARNWMKASGREEYNRFLESADRHFNIWMTYRLTGVNIEDPENPTREPLKEDHAAAVFFNINGAEYVAEKMRDEETGNVAA